MAVVMAALLTQLGGHLAVACAVVALAVMRGSVRDTLRRMGVSDRLSSMQIATSRVAALKAAREYIDGNSVGDTANAVSGRHAQGLAGRFAVAGPAQDPAMR